MRIAHGKLRPQVSADAFVGIDLAIALNKRLPVALCHWQSGRFVPLPLSAPDTPPAPRGMGNVRALDPRDRAQFAEATADYLGALEAYFTVRIRRVAIDAPGAPCRPGLARRRAESALDQCHVSCFTTPSEEAFSRIVERAKGHVRAGGAPARLPHANQIWMLVGFALFRVLSERWPCLEVYPQATARALGVGGLHKSSPGGMEEQLRAGRRHTGWPADVSSGVFAGRVSGARHDACDAYLAAWVAALPSARRRALGRGTGDTIWVPRVASRWGASTGGSAQ